MNIIENYLNAKKAIYDHVGLVEDWVVYPLDFQLEMFWRIDGREISYAEFEYEIRHDTGDQYSDEIYEQRFYKKHIYRGEKYTLIFCNPSVDGMIWWRVFDNKKEC